MLKRLDHVVECLSDSCCKAFCIQAPCLASKIVMVGVVVVVTGLSGVLLVRALMGRDGWRMMEWLWCWAVALLLGSVVSAC